jgi:hypothetical protein
MSLPIRQSDLCAGDVFLSLGEGKTSEAIRQFDGGRYSHAALWTGESVIESTTPRVIEHSLEQSLAAHPREYVDVFRRAGLEHEQRSSIVVEARRYTDRRYAFEHLALGVLVIATSTWLPNEESQLKWLTQVCDIHRFLKLDRTTPGQVVTCTELVARAYADAGVAIRVRPMPAGTFAMTALLAGAAELAQGAKGGEALEETLPGDEWHELRALVRARYAEIAMAAPIAPKAVIVRGVAAVSTEPSLAYQIRAVVRAKYVELTGVEIPESAEQPVRGPDDVAYLAGKNWSASLVTPRYLENSPDLTHVGRLHGPLERLSPEPLPGAVPRGNVWRSRG